MHERPVLFSDAMVRAIVDGRKTQTRRPVKDAGDHILFWRRGDEDPKRWVACDGLPIGYVYCPFGEPGDQLWVRETWGFDCTVRRDFRPYGPCDLSGRDLTRALRFRASHTHDSVGVWRPSIHMPRWASRLTLEIADVRVERLQDLSEEDAKAEGVSKMGALVDDERGPNYRGAFEQLWDSLNTKRAPWESNPWVWVLSFKRIKSADSQAAARV